MVDQAKGPAALGAVVRRAREGRRLSTVAASQLAGISDGLWRQIEAGGTRRQGHWYETRPKARNILAIAKALDLDPEEMFRIAGREDDYAKVADTAPVIVQELSGLPDGLRGLVLAAKELPEWRLKELRDWAELMRLAGDREGRAEER